MNGELLSDIEPRFKLLDNINLPTANYHQEELRLTAHYTRHLGASISFTNTASYRDIQYKFEESGDIIGGPVRSQCRHAYDVSVLTQVGRGHLL